jgi:phosphotransferase system  glucose/maltose/N-acetylglucosamine-specific IIC component
METMVATVVGWTMPSTMSMIRVLQLTRTILMLVLTRNAKLMVVVTKFARENGKMYLKVIAQARKVILIKTLSLLPLMLATGLLIEVVSSVIVEAHLTMVLPLLVILVNTGL